MLKILKATQKDLDECVAISHIKEFSFAHKSSDLKVKKYLNYFLKEGILLVANENNKVIGFVAAEFTLGNFIWVDAIVIDKRHRRKGIGKLLFNKRYIRYKAGKRRKNNRNPKEFLLRKQNNKING